jgi:hypothetical protein
MSNENIISILTKLAEANPKREDFNRAVETMFKCVGVGQFREVYAAGEVVIKLRRYTEEDFPMRQINASNREEARAYKRFLREYPVEAMLVLKPTLVKLPNKHDAVLMERVDQVYGKMALAVRNRFMDEKPLIHNQIQVIQSLFQDGHDNNVGIKGSRAYLIDFNFYRTWNEGATVADVKRVLRAVGVKFPYGKRKRKAKVKAAPVALTAMEAGA